MAITGTSIALVGVTGTSRERGGAVVKTGKGRTKARQGYGESNYHRATDKRSF
jgi:hypothetical protein